MITYAYASISEKGGVNGAIGDQTKKEVKISNEYNFGQTYVIRNKNYKIRKRIRQSAMRFAKNDNIGYGQNDRESGFTECEKIGWKIRKIPKMSKCNMDCSILVTCAVNMAYNDYVSSKWFTSSTLPRLVDSCKDFKLLEYKKGMTIRKGDIIGKTGHVVIACDKGKAGV